MRIRWPLVLLVAITRVMGLDLELSPEFSCHRRDALLGLGTAVAAITTQGASPPIPTWRLDGGVDFPRLALNTAGLTQDGAELAVRNALAAGISHVEFHPGMERDGVANVLRSIQPNRNTVFLTTKMETNWEHRVSAREAANSVVPRIDRDLTSLDVEYLDMVLLRESTNPLVMQAMWAELERELDSGRIRALGVANYCESALNVVLSKAKYKPQVNYLQLHAGMGAVPSTRRVSEALGVKTLAYGHLGEKARPTDDTSQLLKSPILMEIAQAHSKTVPDVALRWVLQTGAAASVRPTIDFELGNASCQNPSCSNGLLASAQAFQWKLTPQEQQRIDAMTTPNSNPTLFSSPGCPNSYFVEE